MKNWKIVNYPQSIEQCHRLIDTLIAELNEYASYILIDDDEQPMAYDSVGSIEHATGTNSLVASAPSAPSAHPPSAISGKDYSASAESAVHGAVAEIISENILGLNGGVKFENNGVYRPEHAHGTKMRTSSDGRR